MVYFDFNRSRLAPGHFRRAAIEQNQLEAQDRAIQREIRE
jgi:hypothetical protein